MRAALINQLDARLKAIIHKKGDIGLERCKAQLQVLEGSYRKLISDYAEPTAQLRDTNQYAWYKQSLLLARAHRGAASCLLERLGANDQPTSGEQAKHCATLMASTTAELAKARDIYGRLSNVTEIKRTHLVQIQAENRVVNSLLANAYQSIAAAYYNLALSLSEGEGDIDQEQAALIGAVLEASKAGYRAVLSYDPAREAAMRKEIEDVHEILDRLGLEPDSSSLLGGDDDAAVSSTHSFS